MTDTAPGTPAEPRLEVVDAPGDQRHELRLDGELVGWSDYSLHDGVLTLRHVETVPAHRGKDFAARLMAGVVDDARARDLQLRPLCSYAVAYLQRHPETHDLIAS